SAAGYRAAALGFHAGSEGVLRKPFVGKWQTARITPDRLKAELRTQFSKCARVNNPYYFRLFKDLRGVRLVSCPVRTRMIFSSGESMILLMVPLTYPRW